MLMLLQAFKSLCLHIFLTKEFLKIVTIQDDLLSYFRQTFDLLDIFLAQEYTVRKKKLKKTSKCMAAQGAKRLPLMKITVKPHERK